MVDADQVAVADPHGLQLDVTRGIARHELVHERLRVLQVVRNSCHVGVLARDLVLDRGRVEKGACGAHRLPQCSPCDHPGNRTRARAL
jgi:hypothetical protein